MKATTEFTEALSADMHIPISALIQVVKGGNNEQGTWLHEDVALEFARWLSPSFAIWCNKRIKELLQYGMTATQPTLEQMINNPDLVISLATQLKSEREEKQRLALEVQKKEQEKQSIIEETVDKAFKKILFSFGSMESLRNFVPFTDDDCIRYVKQAVKLPYHTCFFYALIGYWRLPLRKIIVFALVANAPSVNSVKCNRFLFDKVATYNFL